MSELFGYYMKGDGEEWQAYYVSRENLDIVKPNFTTILHLDRVISEKPTQEFLESVKYVGPMYFDLDDEEDIKNPINDAIGITKKLVEEYELKPTEMEIYLSGKKGIHIIIPPECFMTKVAPMSKLPAIMKEVAKHFAFDSIDFRVYTGKKGRMLRTCYNQRANGKYRVQVSYEELQALTPENYLTMCETPRVVSKAKGEFRPKLAILFETVSGVVNSVKRKKHKPLDREAMRGHALVAEQLMNGECIGHEGFNKIVMQLCLYAREIGMTEEELVAKSSGLIDKYRGDSHRYGSRKKREFAIRSMFAYVYENTAYEYTLGALRSVLETKVVKTTEASEGEVVRADIDTHDEDGEEYSLLIGSEGLVNGVRQVSGCYAVSRGELGDQAISNFILTDIERLVSVREEETVGLKAKMRGAYPVTSGKHLALPIHTLSAASTLHATVVVGGGSFTGTDAHAKGLQQLLMNKTQKSTKYLIETEGVNLVTLTRRGIPPFVVWADAKGVRVPKHVTDAGIDLAFQGYPEPEGAVKTDLSEAPVLGDWLAIEGNRENLAKLFKNLFSCQHPDVVGRTLGWMVACFYRQIFHAVYSQFPLLHVYGAAGSGKTDTVTTMLRMFYWQQRPASVTPSSTPFAFLTMVGGSASIPILMDEYKPATMDKLILERYRAIFRDAYNMKDTHRGGGNRSKDNFSALQKLPLSAPIVFVSEAVETETAIVERYVLVTVKRQPPLLVARNQAKWMFVQANAHIMSILGQAMAARIAQTMSVDQLRKEFDEILEWSREEHMLREEDGIRVTNGEMTVEEFNRRKGNGARNNYNNCVVYFGLLRLKRLIKSALGELFDSELDEGFNRCEGGVFSHMEAIARATVPEYVKILLAISDMSRLTEGSPYALVEDVEYNLTEMGGKQLLVLAPRAAFNKYRAHTRSVGAMPLYPSEASFLEAMYDCPQFIRTGVGTVSLRVDTCVFDAEELQKAGVQAFKGRSKVLSV